LGLEPGSELLRNLRLVTGPDRLTQFGESNLCQDVVMMLQRPQVGAMRLSKFVLLTVACLSLGLAAIGLRPARR